MEQTKRQAATDAASVTIAEANSRSSQAAANAAQFELQATENRVKVQFIAALEGWQPDPNYKKSKRELRLRCEAFGLNDAEVAHIQILKRQSR